MTLAELRTRVSAKLGMDNQASGGDQTLIDALANEAVREILAETHCVVRRATLDLTADTYDYQTPAAVMAILDIFNSASTGGEYRMIRQTIDQITAMRQATGAAPSRFYAVEGHDFLTVYPTPGSGETLTIHYVPKPAEMSAAANDPATETYGGIPVQWHKAIEYYMLRELADYDDHQPSQFGVRYDALYRDYLRKIKRSMLTMGGARPARATWNRARNRPFVSDPSQTVS